MEPYNVNASGLRRDQADVAASPAGTSRAPDAAGATTAETPGLAWGHRGPGLRTSLLVPMVGAVVVVALVAGCAFGLWQARVQTILDTRLNLERLALALAEQTVSSFEAVDLAVLQARAEAARQGDAMTDSKALHDALGSRIVGLPQGQALIVFGPDGAMIAHSREFPTPKVNVADRDYFLAQKNAAGDTPFVSRPLRNRVNGRWMVSLSRGLRDSGGGFAGVVMAAVDVDYFARIYRALHLPEGVAIALRRQDGVVLVSHRDGAPPKPDTASSPNAPAAQTALAAVRTLPGLGLEVELALPERIALEPWRHQATLIGIGTGVSAISIILLLLVVTRQVAKLEQRETALTFLAAIVESSSDAIVGKSPKGIITSWNGGATAIYGYTPEEAIGQATAILAPADRADEFAWLSAAVARGERITQFETVRLRKDGSPVDVSLSLSPVLDRRGTVIGVSSISRDITETVRTRRELTRYRDHLETLVAERTAALTESNLQLAEAKEKAEAASHAKSTFLANMSHEIRTPLNAVLGFAQVLRRSLSLCSEDRESVDIILRSGRNLLALINDLLEMSKIEAGRIEFTPRTFSLPALFDDLHAMFRIPAEAKRLRWEPAHTAPDLPAHIVTDQGKLRQILINLIGNAIKFTETGGVVMRARLTGGGAPRLEIEVADSGPGIPDDEAPRLFEAFQQTTGGLDKGGTGLGLAISRRFARIMGGDITFTAADNGRGTVFRVDLPVGIGDVRDVAAPAERRRPLRLSPGQPEVRVLIADDKQDNRLFLCRLLEPMGFSLREAGNGLQALAICEAWRPHLVLMDIVMPAMDGHEATRRLRSLPGGRQIRVIALSASAFDEDRDSVIASGADDFVRKPVAENDLLAVIASHLGIEYDYGQAVTEAEGSGTADDAPLGPEMLAGVPEGLLDNMRNAVFRSDDLDMKVLISQLSPDKSNLGRHLRRLVDRFDWDALDACLSPRNDG